MDVLCIGTDGATGGTGATGGKRMSLGRHLRPWLLVLPAAITLMAGSGCTAWRGLTIWQNETFEEVAVNWRNHVWARQAWQESQGQFSEHPNCDTFGEGFLAGYCAVCDGGDGCCPPVAPEEYWGWQYQTPEGQSKVAAWFAGYPYGVRAAEQDGVGHMNQVQTSSAVDAQYSQQHPQAAPVAAPSGQQPATARGPRGGMQR